MGDCGNNGIGHVLTHSTNDEIGHISQGQFRPRAAEAIIAKQAITTAENGHRRGAEIGPTTVVF